MSRTLFRTLLVLAALVRLIGLPAEGSPDVSTFRIWTYAAATMNPATMYGTGNQYGPEEFVVRYKDGDGTVVQYPPLSLYLLSAVGHIYQTFFPTFPDGTPLTMAIKLLEIVASALLTALIWRLVSRRYGEDAGRLAAVAYWANPAIVLQGSFLGYIDPVFALPTIAALFAASEGAAVTSGALLAAGLMIKPQAVFAGPAVVLLLAANTTRGWRPVLSAAAAGAIASLAILWPVIDAHAFMNMLFALRGTISDGMLSGNAANAWWLAGYAIQGGGRAAILQMSDVVFTSRRILGHGMGGLMMVTATWAMLVAGMLALMWRARRRIDLLTGAALTALVVHLYFVLGVQVHENHLFLALPALAIVAAVDARYRRLFAAVSLISFLNLNLFYGFGFGQTSALRDSVHALDLTIALAAVNVVVLIWHVSRFLTVGDVNRATLAPT